MTDELRALLLALCVWGGLCFAGGRYTAPVPPAEVRYVPVHVPAPAPLAEAVPIEPAAESPVVPVPVEPPPVTGAPVDAKPIIPAPRPKIEAKPKPHAKPEVRKSRPVRAPTAAECAQLRFGLATIGRDGVTQKAKERGYSRIQVAGALTACNL